MTRHSTRHHGRALSTALLALMPLLVPTSLHATTKPEPSVVMLSDIHFDPFHDPAKFAQLRKASVTSWPTILDAPDSPTQAQDFADLQKTCGARGVDTPNALLKSSVHEAYIQQPKPLFVAVSGDLMAHQFNCRFHTLAPSATDADYSAFAAKTVSFVAYELWLSYPHTPIYIALGNNDSGCEDYREDPNSSFLRADAISISANAKTPKTRYRIQKEFGHFGDYNILLPKPMSRTHLIVLQDIFDSKKYTSCAGTAPTGNMTPAEIQVAWLRTQLAAARKSHQTVWVMAHIPPGVDAYSNFAKHRNVCNGETPETFLGSDALQQAITDYGDVVRLALFAHTHMDELRAYKSTASTKTGPTYIPGKLVPSISPVNGNYPAFTVAQVDPKTATVRDYTVYLADKQTGIDTTWKQEYRYSAVYGMPDLSGESLEKLTSGFASDHTGSDAASQSYQQYFSAGTQLRTALAMQVAWPTYTCAMTAQGDTDFKSCMCPAKPSEATTTTP